MSKTKFYEDHKGNASSSRAIGMFIIVNAVFMVWACIIFGFIHKDQFAAAIGSGVGLFTAMTTATFVYLYNNKKKELQNEKDPAAVPGN